MSKLTEEQQERFEDFSRLPNDEKVLLIIKFQDEKDFYKKAVTNILKMFESLDNHFEDACDCVYIERYIKNIIYGDE